MNNKKRRKYDDIFRLTKILVRPKHALATFSPSRVRYFFLASLDLNKTRIREGSIIFQKPHILLAEDVQELFEGYGSEVAEFIEELYETMRRELRLLGYHFRNEPAGSRIIAESFGTVLRSIKDSIAGEPHQAVISGIDGEHELSVLKLTLELIMQSFPGNITELEEHNLFVAPAERAATRIRTEIEGLFAQARRDPAVIKLLGKKLQDYNLFKQYEDRFFELVSASAAHR